MADEKIYTNVGHATAYSYAKSKGYTGTEDEFAEELAQVAENAQAVREDREYVDATVEGFVQTTVPAAVQSVTAEGTTQIGNVQTAGTTQVGNVQAEGTTQVGRVTAEGTTQVGLVTAEGTTQKNAVTAKGQEVIESIPSDYTELTEEVEDLKSSIFDSFRVLTDASIWSQGGISTSTGNPNSNSNRIRTSYIKRANVRYLSAPSGYKYIVTVYSSKAQTPSDAYISGYNDKQWIRGTRCITDINEEYYICITLAYDTGVSPDPDILPTEGVKMSFYYGTDESLTSCGVPADAETTGIATRLMPYGLEPFQLSLFKQSANLFSELCYHVSGGYYREQNDTTKNYPRISTTPNWQGWLIRVKPSTTYAVGEIDYKIQFLKANGTLDTEFTNQSSTSPNIITTGQNSYWMCLTQSISRDMTNWMMVEGDTYPSEYISGHPQWVAEPQCPVTNKTIAFFGDSITAGSGVTGQPDSQCYHQYIHDLYGYTCLNYAYGGSGYVVSYTNTSETAIGLHGIGQSGRGISNKINGFTPNNVRTRLAEVDPTTLDAVVIFAGTNDWSNSTPLADFATELDTTFEYYQNTFGSVPLLVMTPIHRLNDTTNGIANLSEYVDIIIQKCKDHGIPYIDTFTMSGLQPNNSGNRAVFFPRDDGGNDGVHPNHLAHLRIERAIGETINQLVLWNTSIKR